MRYGIAPGYYLYRGRFDFEVDGTRSTASDKRLLKHHKLVGPPAIVFFDKARHEISGLRVIGFEPPEKFLQTLERALRAR